MKIKLPFILVILSLFLIYWTWWLPGPRVAGDFSLVSQNTLKSLMNLPQAWSVSGTEGLGEYTAFTLWSWPFNFLYGLIANLNLAFALLERILILIPFLFLGAFGIWKFCENIQLSIYAKSIAVLFYLTNTYIILVIDGGQLTISLSYALFPLTFLAVEKSLLGNLKRKIIAGLLISVLGSFDIRFLYIFLILVLIRFFYEFLFLIPKKWSFWILSFIKTGFVIGIIIIGINFYWLFALLKAPISSTIFTSLIGTSFISFITFGHSLLLYSPHWFKNIFGNVNSLQIEFILIPVLVFLSPIIRSKNRTVGFWLLVALISTFLAKGSSEPFNKFYPWLYSNIPGFSLFRDSSKFFFLVALSYSVLIGITVDGLIIRIKNYKIKTILLFVLFSYLIILVRPVWLNQMTGTFSQNPFADEYLKLNTLLQNQKPGNIFWIPTISPLTVLDIQHPAVEASRLAQKRPFAQGILGTYELFNYLREAPYMGQLFDVANIGYIAYPLLDFRRERDSDKIKYYYTFLNQLSNLSWLQRETSSPIPLLKVKTYQEKLFISPSVWWIIGSDSIYNEATKSAELSLSKNALIFEEESAGLGKRLSEIPNAKIVLFHKNALDLAASFFDKDKIIFPADKLNHDPDKGGWWKRATSDFIEWKNFLKEKYGLNNQDFDLGGGWAVGEKSVKLKINLSKAKKGEILLARVMESSRSGELSFYQGGNLIGKINTDNKETNVRWFEVGFLADSNEAINIESNGDINVINAITSLPIDELNGYKNRASEYKSKIEDFNEKNVEKVFADLSFRQISPTSYEINITSLEEPTFLVFSQNFDYNWKLNGKSSLPVYSLLNGFVIDKNGKYELTFEPQKYLLEGFTISIITVFTSLLLLLV